jgi:hypothetical protein
LLGATFRLASALVENWMIVTDHNRHRKYFKDLGAGQEIILDSTSATAYPTIHRDIYIYMHNRMTNTQIQIIVILL